VTIGTTSGQDFVDSTTPAQGLNQLTIAQPADNTTTNEVVITHSPELRRELRRQAAALNVPVEWLAAGLVCDTIEEHKRW
jgi:hypothetical protein